MNDDEPQTVGRMLLYLYTLDYPDDDISHIRGERGATEYSPPLNKKRKVSVTTGEGTDSDTASGVATSDDPRMMNNVLIYAIAEKYDIPELKELAKCKFHILASSRWPHDGFDAIAKAVFSTTPENDMGLRQIVLDICEEHFFEILKHGELRGRLLEIEAIAAVAHGAAVRKIDVVERLLDGVLANQTVLKEEVSKAKADTQEAVDQKNKWISQLDSLLRKSNNAKRCSVCGKFSRSRRPVRRSGTSSELVKQFTCRCGKSLFMGAQSDENST